MANSRFDALKPKMRERLLAAIVESSDDIIVSKTLKGIITSWNSAAERILGYPAEEAIGRSILLIVPPELTGEEAQIIEKVSRGERVEHMETVRLTKDGRRIPLSLTISPVRDETGNIVGASKIARDISLQKQIERERETLLRRADEANRMKDEFLATLSHELRNPLNAVIGWTNLLQAGSLTPEKTKQAWETVQRNLSTEVRLISDLLDVSRIMSGHLRLDVRPFEFIKLIEETVDVFGPATEAKGIRISCLLDPTAGPVAGDPSRLQQVLWNLLSNSVKFTPEGGSIEVRLQRMGSNVEISVSDNGVGIDPGFLPHVFERFRQHDSTTSRQFGGLGLGLTIVQQIVELHGGSVSARSAGAGKGATFTVALPLAVVSQPIEMTHRNREPAAGIISAPVIAAIRGLKVLAIDDEPDACELISTLLGQVDAEVRTARSAAAGLEVLDEWIPNVVLCDIGMPGQDGYEFVRQLRRRPAESGGSVPAAALTAYARTEDRLLIMSAGFQMHLPKPIQPEELLASVVALSNLEPPKSSQLYATGNDPR